MFTSKKTTVKTLNISPEQIAQMQANAFNMLSPEQREQMTQMQVNLLNSLTSEQRDQMAQMQGNMTFANGAMMFTNGNSQNAVHTNGATAEQMNMLNQMLAQASHNRVTMNSTGANTVVFPMQGTSSNQPTNSMDMSSMQGRDPIRRSNACCTIV